MRQLGRTLLVESAPRDTGELVLARLNSDSDAVDVLTCYETGPAALLGQLHSVHSAEARDRRAFIDTLARGGYQSVVIIVAGSGVLAKWKWAIAARTNAKLYIADEFGDYWDANWRNLPALAVLAIRRSNVASLPQLLIAVAKILLAPLTILYLIACTFAIHARVIARRRIRT